MKTMKSTDYQSDAACGFFKQNVTELNKEINSLIAAPPLSPDVDSNTPDN